MSVRPVHLASLSCCVFVLATSTPARADEIPQDTSSPVAASQPKGPVHQTGNASFYAHRFRGRKTASGEIYDPAALTAAHRTLPMGTKLQITNPKNNKSVIVTVNDRGRLPKGRVVDVSSAAADALDMKKSGVTKVETRIVGKAAALPAEAARPESPADSAATP